MDKRPDEARLWIRATRSFNFLRDKDMRLKLYKEENGKLIEIPCSMKIEERNETLKNCIQEYYNELRSRYGYKT